MMIAEIAFTGTPVTVEPRDTPVCRFAIVCDPDGNNLMLHPRKTK